MLYFARKLKSGILTFRSRNRPRFVRLFSETARPAIIITLEGPQNTHISSTMVASLSRISLALTLATSAAAFTSTSQRNLIPTARYSSIPGSLGTGEGWIDPSAPVNSEASLKYTLSKSLEGSKFQKRLSILGSTGSIGTQTLDIVDACPDNFSVDALSAGTNAQLMAEQVMKYSPLVASMATAESAQQLERILKERGCADMPRIVWGDDGIVEAATVSSADTVVTGIVGAAGLKPTIEAIKLKKDIALANKETLISGGPVINPLVEKHGINMVRQFSISYLTTNTCRLTFHCHHVSFPPIVNTAPFFNVFRAFRPADYDESF